MQSGGVGLIANVLTFVLELLPVGLGLGRGGGGRKIRKSLGCQRDMQQSEGNFW